MFVCPSGLLLMRLVNYRPASYVHDDLPLRDTPRRCQIFQCLLYSSFMPTLDT